MISAMLFCFLFHINMMAIQPAVTTPTIATIPTITSTNDNTDNQESEPKPAYKPEVIPVSTSVAEKTLAPAINQSTSKLKKVRHRAMSRKMRKKERMMGKQRLKELRNHKRHAAKQQVSQLAPAQQRATPPAVQLADTRVTQRLAQKTGNLNPQVLKLALHAYEKAQRKGYVSKPYLTVIDYSLPSSQKRMWVIDVKHAAVTFHTYVAHGRNSGDLHATRFSNESGSKASSLGTFITSTTYQGHVGYALNLNGLDKGFNDKALSRRVVIHGADYVSSDFLASHGRLGRSWGCPAIERSLAPKVINQIKGGSVVFAYYPQKQWLQNSQMLAA